MSQKGYDRGRKGYARPHVAAEAACVCGKVAYPHDVAAAIARAHTRRGDPMQAYRCVRGRTWHVGHASDAA